MQSPTVFFTWFLKKFLAVWFVIWLVAHFLALCGKCLWNNCGFTKNDCYKMFRNMVAVVDDGLASRSASAVFLPTTLFLPPKKCKFLSSRRISVFVDSAPSSEMSMNCRLPVGVSCLSAIRST